MRISKSYIVIILCVALMLPALASAERKKLKMGGNKNKKEPVANIEIAEGTTVTMEEFLIPLADETADHTVKLVIALEFIDIASAAQFTAKKAAIRDTVLSAVGIKTRSQVKKVPDRLALRDELKKKINDIFGTELVAKVYFSDFALQ
jgi:flagellar basal body-associated protein FliL